MLSIVELVQTAESLLKEFRLNSFLDPKKENNFLKKYLGELNKKWDLIFPNFPERKKKIGSIEWKFEKQERSKYLINIISVISEKFKHNIIINPACYTGRRAREIARVLPNCVVVATDIDPKWNKYWNFFSKFSGKKEPKNYQFKKDNIFDSKLNIVPEAVVFFGACGSVSDGIIDYAIQNKSPFLVSRTCCHDNIGGNIFIQKKNSLLNLYFRYKNFKFKKRKEMNQGDYFSDKYSPNSYPRSNAIKQISNSSEYMRIAQNSVESELCELLIDIDRCCYLIEHGYEVLYRDELFFAELIKKQ